MSLATALLRRARAEPFTLPAGLRSLVDALHDSWLMQWTIAELEALGPERADDALAFLDAQLANEAVTGRPRTALEGMRAEVLGVERLRAAVEALRAGRRAEAYAMLAELASDTTVSERLRREAERIAQSSRGN